MVASCCICMAWRTVLPRASVVALALCVWAHMPAGAGLVVRGGGLSCELETCRGGPVVGNWSEMQPTSRRLDVLPVWVLTRVFPPPYHESLP
jgi:hypothetical protein